MTIITDQLTQIELSGFPGPIGTTHSLGDSLPGGALAAEHIQYRTRKPPAAYSGWNNLVAWDQVARVATIGSVPTDHTLLQFRRRTPRFFLYQPPTALEARVDRENLRINANQGYMVAYEWAAELGVDPKVSLLQPDYSISTPVRLLSQTHYGPEVDFTKREWDFHFSGGYISRSHVKVQVKVNGVWALQSLDTQSWKVPTNPATNKFIGPWTLQLQLPAGTTGMVIHRFTPRTGEVSYPDSDVPITATNMEPSAMHALFVAVELGEQLSKYSPCECDQLYTSLIYPVIVTDDTKVSAAARPSGFLWGIGDDEAKVSAPTIIGGVLGVYVANYSGPIEEIQVTTPPTIYSGSLVVQVIFYNNFVPDEAQVTTPPTIQSGSLVTQVIFYNNFVPDEVQVTTPPTIQSGSLT